MNSIIIVLIVAIVFILLSKNFIQNPVVNRISLDDKKNFKGDLKNHEAGLLVALMAKVAKADGVVSELEAELIKNTLDDISKTFENSDEIRRKLLSIYSKEKEDFSNTLKIAKKYADLTKFDYQKRLVLLEYLLNLAFIDGEFAKNEQMITEDIASALGIKNQDYENLVSSFRAFYAKKQSSNLGVDGAYEVLGISKESSFDEVKKRYRELVRKNHPDILMGQGKGEEDIKKATLELQKINEAYELIKNQQKG